MSQIVSFGSLLTFSIELERGAAEFYEQCAKHSQSADLLQALARGNRKRSATLERVRRENVTEMILEPIADLDAGHVAMPDAGSEDWLPQSIEFEEQVGRGDGQVEAGGGICASLKR